jgi:hypothetical protein
MCAYHMLITVCALVHQWSVHHALIVHTRAHIAVVAVMCITLMHSLRTVTVYNYHHCYDAPNCCGTVNTAATRVSHFTLVYVYTIRITCVYRKC